MAYTRYSIYAVVCKNGCVCVCYKCSLCLAFLLLHVVAFSVAADFLVVDCLLCVNCNLLITVVKANSYFVGCGAWLLLRDASLMFRLIMIHIQVTVVDFSALMLLVGRQERHPACKN